MYSKQIIDRFTSPINSGLIKNASGVGSETYERLGEVAKVYLKVEDGIVKDAKFKVFGGIVLIAVFDVAMDMLKDKKIDEIYISEEDIASVLGAIDVDKLYAIKLCKDTIADAVKDYHKKQKKLELLLLKAQAMESTNNN